MPEEWEEATQAIQNLPPRTALVKVPQRAVAKIYTLPIPPPDLSQEAQEVVRARLLKQIGQPYPTAPQAPESHPAVGQVTDYEPI